MARVATKVGPFFLKHRGTLLDLVLKVSLIILQAANKSCNTH